MVLLSEGWGVQAARGRFRRGDDCSASKTAATATAHSAAAASQTAGATAPAAPSQTTAPTATETESTPPTTTCQTHSCLFPTKCPHFSSYRCTAPFRPLGRGFLPARLPTPHLTPPTPCSCSCSRSCQWCSCPIEDARFVLGRRWIFTRCPRASTLDSPHQRKPAPLARIGGQRRHSLALRRGARFGYPHLNLPHPAPPGDGSRHPRLQRPDRGRHQRRRAAR
mmetsp:Transcript_39676/g.93189  ORF Transcript_39676/g.93189 Transcript_39676/m.93189 type:complete len:223 (-) Transcript_39676:552-1220(-)